MKDINEIVQEASRRNYETVQRLNQQRFDEKQISRQIAASQEQTNEIVRTLRNYNSMVERFYNETMEKLEESKRETAKAERTVKILTFVEVLTAIAGVVASIVIGIFF